MIARITGYVVVVLGLVVALSAVGLDFGPVITILVVVVLVTVLIRRPLLADLGAGVVLQSRRPLAVDEIIKAGEFEGVEGIDGRVVQLRTWDGWQVRIRNSDVLTDPIVKVADPGRIRIEFPIGLHYDSDLDAAVNVARRTLADTPGVLAQPEPTALIEEFGESNIELRCSLWCDPQQQGEVKDEAMRNAKRAFDDAGIVIAYPQRVLHAP